MEETNKNPESRNREGGWRAVLRDLRERLYGHVFFLAGKVGERHVGCPAALYAAGSYIAQCLERYGLKTRSVGYSVGGVHCENVEGTLPGRDSTSGSVVIGAHYDTVPGSPGANDNATGVGALLELARRFSATRFRRTLRFVAFANEEPPHFQTSSMGSLVYARRLRQAGEKVLGMLSLETIGYYREEAGTQKYPFPLGLWYPSVGNFIAFVGCRRYRVFLKRVLGAFRCAVGFPCEGAAPWAGLPGVGWSDHWSFWQQGYAAVMVTDTALYRYPFYHTPEDTPEKINYEKLAEVVEGLAHVIARLAGGEERD